MNRRQQRFVLEFLQDANPAQAALRAGYARGGLYALVYRLLRRPDIRAALEREMAARSARTGISAERVIDELMRIAFAEIGALVEWDASQTCKIGSAISG